MSRSRNWCFTINNFSDVFEPLDFVPEDAFVAWQSEVGESGTPHLQGYIEFPDKVRLGGVKELHPTAHWEPRKGSQKQALDYVTKSDETYREGPWCYGHLKEQGARSDLQAVYDAVVEGKSDADIQAEHTDVYFKYYKAIDRVRANLLQPRDSKPLVLWYYGSTGTGKTRTAYEENPGAYFKDMSDGKWWDGYRQQECVVFDDLRKDTFKFHELLRILDRYPLQVQYKGGSVHFNSPKIIVTSCFHPKDLFETREDLAQLLRRIDKVVHFAVPVAPPLEKRAKAEAVIPAEVAGVGPYVLTSVMNPDLVDKIRDLYPCEYELFIQGKLPMSRFVKMAF